MPDNILRNPPLCFFTSFLIVSPTSFINKLNYSSDLIVFMISFKTINVVVPDLNIFLWIAASVAAATVNPNDIKMLSANGVSVFFIKGNPVFSNGPKCLPTNPPDCPILCN